MPARLITSLFLSQLQDKGSKHFEHGVSKTRIWQPTKRLAGTVERSHKIEHKEHVIDTCVLPVDNVHPPILGSNSRSEIVMVQRASSRPRGANNAGATAWGPPDRNLGTIAAPIPLVIFALAPTSVSQARKISVAFTRAKE